MDFRPIEKEDLKYLWAGYKQGNLASLGEKFASGEMEPPEFDEAIYAEVIDNYHGAWTLFAESSKGFMPVGVVLAFFSHPRPELAPFMIVGDMIWFSWASTRNRIESAVNFFNEARKEMPMMEYARQDSKRFFEIIAKHGIMRRVGTSHNVYPDESTAIFETRKWR